MATSRDPTIELTRQVDELFFGFHRQLDLLKEKFLRNMKESIAKQPRTYERRQASSQTEEQRSDAENELESEFQLVELPDCFDLNKPWQKRDDVADKASGNDDDDDDEDEDVNIKEWEESIQRCVDSDAYQQQQQQHDIQHDACLIDLLNLESDETEAEPQTPPSPEEPAPSTPSVPAASQAPPIWYTSTRPRYPDHNPAPSSHPTAPVYPAMPTYPGQYQYRPNSYVPRLNEQPWQSPQLPPSVVQHIQTPVWYPPQQLWRPNAPLAQYLQFVAHQG